MCISTPELSTLTVSSSNSVINRGCESLSHWISRLKAKEAILKSSRERDLRREVLLLKATQRAQAELVHQQRLNRQRWEEVKARQLERCSFCAAFKHLCSCKSEIMEDSEESKKLDEFFESMSSRKRRPSILRASGSCKRAKA